MNRVRILTLGIEAFSARTRPCRNEWEEAGKLAHLGRIHWQMVAEAGSNAAFQDVFATATDAEKAQAETAFGIGPASCTATTTLTLGTIDWTGLIAFITAMIPLIEAMIPILSPA